MCFKREENPRGTVAVGLAKPELVCHRPVTAIFPSCLTDTAALSASSTSFSLEAGSISRISTLSGLPRVTTLPITPGSMLDNLSLTIFTSSSESWRLANSMRSSLAFDFLKYLKFFPKSVGPRCSFIVLATSEYDLDAFTKRAGGLVLTVTLLGRGRPSLAIGCLRSGGLVLWLSTSDGLWWDWFNWGGLGNGGKPFDSGDGGRGDEPGVG